MKRNLILIGAFALLLIVYLLTRSSEQVVSTDRPFIQCDSAKVTSIKVENKDGKIELAKQGEDWTVVGATEYPANKRSVGDAVSKLGQMKKLSMITEKSDRYAEFEVDDETATRVSVTQQGKTTVFLLGKAGSSMQTSFARLQGSKEVWEIGGNYAGTLKKKPTEWRDKTITDLNMADIKKVTLQYPKNVISLALVDSVWKVDAGKAQFDGDKSLVERLTRMISKISTVEFADTLAPDAFNNPELHLVVELSSGDPIDFKLIPKDAEGSQYFLRKAGARTDFVIYKATYTALAKKADDFKKKEDEPASASAKKPRV
jgi:hypothetical protein